MAEEKAAGFFSTPAFSLLQSVVSVEETPTSHRYIAGKWRVILIAFPDDCGLYLTLYPKPTSSHFLMATLQYGIWNHYQRNFLILLNKFDCLVSIWNGSFVQWPIGH